jgi:hypothetical protein
VASKLKDESQYIFLQEKEVFHHIHFLEKYISILLIINTLYFYAWLVPMGNMFLFKKDEVVMQPGLYN